MERFLVIAETDDGPFMELLDEKHLGEWIDGADYLPVVVKEIYVLRDGKLVRCEFGDIERVPGYPDDDYPSIIYAYSPLFAGTEKVGSIALTDH